MINDAWDVAGFLSAYPKMTLAPYRGGATVIEGVFDFGATAIPHGDVVDSYELRLSVPQSFPKHVPSVTETGGRIPRLQNNHVNSDGTICLGSTLQLLLRIATAPTLPGFAQTCLIPYLYAMTLKLKYKKPFVFGELPHGTAGELEDYKSILEVPTEEQVRMALDCLALNKRLANKLPCPCKCGRRLGKCDYNRHLSRLRDTVGVAWLRS